jgi:hypothetical protein
MLELRNLQRPSWRSQRGSGSSQTGGTPPPPAAATTTPLPLLLTVGLLLLTTAAAAAAWSSPGSSNACPDCASQIAMLLALMSTCPAVATNPVVL